MSRDIRESQDIRDCLAYFKHSNGFARLFEGIRDKYASLGHMGGNIVLKDLKPNEKDALKGFLRKDFSSNKQASIPVAEIERALLGTRFEGIALYDIVCAYFGGDIQTKKQLHGLRERNRQLFFEELLDEIEWPEGRSWLSHVLDTRIKPYDTIMEKYKRDAYETRTQLLHVIRALHATVTDTSIKRLAVFAARVTGNPHYLDDKSEADSLFTEGLCFFFSTPTPTNAFEKAELLYKAGIVRDDISNFTVCYGITAIGEDGKVDAGWQGFNAASQPLHASLMNISGLSTLTAYDLRIHTVYIVENPTVFSSLLDAARYADLHPALVCGNGQPRLATLILLDKLVSVGLKLLYAGDFDPEGLSIADRLKQRYGDALGFWRYTEADYLAALSNEAIPESRLSKLKKLTDPCLKDLAAHINEHKRAGYQETIMDSYISDIQERL